MLDANGERERCCMDRLIQVIKLMCEKTKLQLDQIMAVMSDKALTVKFLPHDEFREHIPEVKQQVNDVFMMVKSLQSVMRKYLVCHNVEVSLWSDKLDSEKFFHPGDFSGNLPKGAAQEIPTECRRISTCSSAINDESFDPRSMQHSAARLQQAMNLHEASLMKNFPMQGLGNMPDCSSKLTTSIQGPISSVIPFPGPNIPQQPTGIQPCVQNARQELLFPPLNELEVTSPIPQAAFTYGGRNPLAEVQLRDLEAISKNPSLLGSILNGQEFNQMCHTQKPLRGSAVDQMQSIARLDPVLLQKYLSKMYGDLMPVARTQLSISSLGISANHPTVSVQCDDLLERLNLKDTEMTLNGLSSCRVADAEILETSGRALSEIVTESPQLMMPVSAGGGGVPDLRRPIPASVGEVVPDLRRLIPASVGEVVPDLRRPIPASVGEVVPDLRRPIPASVGEVMPDLRRPASTTSEDNVDGSGIPLGKPINVYLTYLKSPVAWIQMNDCKIDELQDYLSEQMEAYCGPKLDTICPGHKVAAKYDLDGAYHRAVVKSCIQEDMIILVQFIDYGNCEMVHEKNIHPLPHDLLDIPPIALPCLVTHIDGVAVDLAGQGEMDFLQSRFQRHLTDGTPLKAVLKQLPKSHEDDATAVEYPSYTAGLYTKDIHFKKDFATDEPCLPLVNQTKAITSDTHNVSGTVVKASRGVSPASVEVRHNGKVGVLNGLEGDDIYGSSRNLKSGSCWSSTSPLVTDLTQDASPMPPGGPKHLFSLLKPQVSFKAERQPVILAHVKSLRLFYIHFVNDETANIDRFHEVMSNHYREDKQILHLKELPIGSYWAVRHEDEQWYRGQVTANILTQKGMNITTRVKVHYVDYGDDGIACVEDIRVLQEDFTYMPILAVPCCLAMVSASESCLESLSEEKSKEAFVKKCGGYKAVLYAQFVLSDVHGIHQVVLFNEVGEVINNSIDGRDEVSHAMCKPKDLSPVKGAVNKKELCFERCSESLELPQVGALLDVFVTVITSPAHFYAYSPTGMKDLRETHSKIGQNANLQVLRQSMNQYYRYSLPQRNQQSLGVSELKVVCEVNNGATEYSRVRILETRREKETLFVKVFFIDYGEDQWVHEEQVRPLAPQFSHLPPQAVECWLDGLEEPQNEWDMQSTFHLQKLTDGRALVAEVAAVDRVQGRLGVVLHDSVTGQDINTVLKDMLKMYLE